MEQKDYLLREIEKIGMVLRAILDKLFDNTGNPALTIESRFAQTSEQLLDDTGFDLTRYLTLEETASQQYLAQYRGMNATNIELLAEVLFHSGMLEQAERRRVFLTRALQLFQLCIRTDKTFSFEREEKINRIENMLQ